MLNKFNTQIPKRLASQTLAITPPSEAIRCFSDEKHHPWYPSTIGDVIRRFQPGGGLALAMAVFVALAACGPRRSSKMALMVEGDEDSKPRYSDREALPAPPALSAQTPNADYLRAVEAKIQPAWSSFLEDCRVRLPASHALNTSSLAVELDLVMSQQGEVLAVRPTTKSGNSEFDQVAHEIASDLASLPIPPVTRISDDGRVYLHWGFARDHRQAGAATASWKRVELPLVEALPTLLEGSQYAVATQRILEANPTGTEKVALLRLVADAIVGEGLVDAEASIQVVALHSVAVAGLGTHLPQVRIAARSTEGEVAAAAMGALAAVGNDKDTTLLVAFALGVIPVAAKTSGAAALALVKMGRNADTVVADLQTDNAAARNAAYGVLSVLPKPDSVPQLSEIVLGAKSERAERSAAAFALGRQALTSKKALKTLLACTSSGAAAIRGACASAIADAAVLGLRSRVAYWKVLELSKDRDERVRAASIRAAAALDPSRFAKELGGIKVGGSQQVLLSLARSLAKIPGRVAVTRLVDLSVVSHQGMRTWAARGLAIRTEPKAVLALQQLMTDPVVDVRLAALQGLSDDAEVELRLGDESARVQAWALATLTARNGQEGTALLLADKLVQAGTSAKARLLLADAWLTGSSKTSSRPQTP